MSTRKKRPCPSDENDELKASVKKQKTCDDSNKITSPLFKDEKDQKKFQEIFDSIHSSQLFMELGPVRDISQCIAEYGMGEIKDCAGYCRQQILILEGNKSNLIINGDEYYCCKCKDDYDRCGCEDNHIHKIKCKGMSGML